MEIFNPPSRVNPVLNKGYPQEGLTRLAYLFHVNAYKHLTAKGLPFGVIQPGSDANPGSCKEALTKHQKLPLLPPFGRTHF